MDRTKLLLLYSLSLAVTIPAIFPQLHLFFFAPCLILIYYQKPLISCMWIALFCGLFIDILSSQTRLGIHALNYCIVTKILYSQKIHFFEEKLSTLPLFTFIFATLSTLIQIFLLHAFGQGMTLSWDWVKSDLLLMPLGDACYAFVAFTIPLFFLPKPRQKKTRLFSLKEHADG